MAQFLFIYRGFIRSRFDKVAKFLYIYRRFIRREV